MPEPTSCLRPRAKLRAEYSQKFDPLRERCSGRAAIDVVRGRWKASILHQLRSGTKRFTELQQCLNGITAQALTVQLRQLEEDEVLARAVFAEIPARVEYSLTGEGRSLAQAMEQLEVWGARYLQRQKALRDIAGSPNA